MARHYNIKSIYSITLKSVKDVGRKLFLFVLSSMSMHIKRTQQDLTCFMHFMLSESKPINPKPIKNNLHTLLKVELHFNARHFHMPLHFIRNKSNHNVNHKIGPYRYQYVTTSLMNYL